VHAPALIGLHRKSIYHPSAEAQAVERAVIGARGTKMGLPVYYGTKKLAYVIGDPWNKRTLVRSAAGLDSIQSALLNNQRWQQTFFKNNTSGTASNTAWYDWWSCNGDPIPSSSPYGGTANTARSFDDTAEAGIKNGPRVGANFFKQVSKVCAQTSNIQTLMLLYDRVVAYDNNIWSSTLLNFNNTVTAPRYGTNGSGGLQICCTNITASGVGPVVLSALTYVNDQGTAGQTVPIQTGHTSVQANAVAQNATFGAQVVCPWSPGASNGVGPFFCLGQNDLGAQQVTSIQFSANDGTNTYCLFLCRPICWVVIPATGVFFEQDLISNITSFEQVQDGAHLSLIVNPPPAGSIQGYVEFVWS
jgi:hypothetical protein